MSRTNIPVLLETNVKDSEDNEKRISEIKYILAAIGEYHIKAKTKINKLT